MRTAKKSKISPNIKARVCDIELLKQVYIIMNQCLILSYPYKITMLFRYQVQELAKENHNK